MSRKGDWIQTFTGRQFWPLDPKPEDICIEDIAHALSNACRYNGHTLGFYSVAEHSVIVSESALMATRDFEGGTPLQWDTAEGMRGLLHDAAEAYLSDVPRPIKPMIPGYKAIEAGIERAVALAFSLDPFESELVKNIDHRMLINEQAIHMAAPPAEWAHHPGGKVVGVWFRHWNPRDAERGFLDQYQRCLS